MWTKKLGMYNLYARWVPRLLSAKNKFIQYLLFLSWFEYGVSNTLRPIRSIVLPFVAKAFITTLTILFSQISLEFGNATSWVCFQV